MTHIDPSIAEVADRLEAAAAALPEPIAHRRFFMDTYRRTTLAVGETVQRAGFEDPDWVSAWDVAFAELFFDAHEADLAGRPVPRPWRLAFDAPADLPPLRLVLLGMNAHVNYDLPQSLLAVISDADFKDLPLMNRRRRDHERIDGVLASRVAAEDGELKTSTVVSILDTLLTPLNRAGSKRFLREARLKVWHNTMALQQARLSGADAYASRLAELEVLSAARIADLMAPGQVLLRLAVAGFGVMLPPL